MAIQKLKFQEKTPLKSNKIGIIIFAKVLEKPMDKYLSYINKTQYPEVNPTKDNNYSIYAILNQKENSGIGYQVTTQQFKKKYSRLPTDNRQTRLAKRWINKRNRFTKHILESLIKYQKEYFISGRDFDLKPLTMDQFLQLYPCKQLDISRLSRLSRVVPVETPYEKIIYLHDLFISKKTYYAHRIKRIIVENEKELTDIDIQKHLREKGVSLSVRTICNYRMHLKIPNYKERALDFYGKNIDFSNPISITRKNFNRLPSLSGVYELRLSSPIKYEINKSEVIYLGASSNLRKRLSCYSGSSMKNKRLKKFCQEDELFARYLTCTNYFNLEKELLTNFKNNYGELPKANLIGG